nr:hypothetical protein [Candidatus Woesearchaeota archaeon]
MRLINKLRFKYSILFLIIGLVVGYFIASDNISFKSITSSSVQEIPVNPIEKVTETKEEFSLEGILGFATITSSNDDKNDLIILGFEGLKPLSNNLYEGWIVEFKDDEAIAKISTGKFNIDENGYIVDQDNKVISDDPFSAKFAQIGSNDEVDWPVNLLDSSRDYRIVITIESKEPANDFTPSDNVILAGKVEESKIVALKPLVK